MKVSSLTVDKWGHFTQVVWKVSRALSALMPGCTASRMLRGAVSGQCVLGLPADDRIRVVKRLASTILL